MLKMKLQNKKAAMEGLMRIIILIIVFLIVLAGLYLLLRFLGVW